VEVIHRAVNDHILGALRGVHNAHALVVGLHMNDSGGTKYLGTVAHWDALLVAPSGGTAIALVQVWPDEILGDKGRVLFVDI
jgi:hypothetical protein